MTYHLVLTCAMVLLNVGLALGGSEVPDPQELCFGLALQNSSWIECVSPIMSQVHEDMRFDDIAAVCLSGEETALHCLLTKLDECYGFLVGGVLSPIGLTAEEAAVSDITSLWNDEIVDIICTVYGGHCEGLDDCRVTPASLLEESAPLTEAVQAVVGLCGPKCYHDITDICPSPINFLKAAFYVNFTKDFDGARIERTRTFMDENCMKAANFEAACILLELDLPVMKTCYDRVLEDYNVHNDLCLMYDSMKICIDSVVKPDCGPVSCDLLLEGLMVTLPEALPQSCQRDASAGLKMSVSFLLFTVWTLLLF